jgi:membrane associated rhomboid family serine protease
MSLTEETKSSSKVFLGQDNNALVMLFALNAILFVILKFIYVVYQMSDLNIDAYYKNIFNWFILPADISRLGNRPWVLLSSMFTDGNVFDFIANMFWLWAFGYILQELTGNKKLVPLFIYGGLAGSLVYVLSYNLVPRMVPDLPVAALYGANASVMAIAIATTTIEPDYRLFPMINRGIPLWILTLVFVVVDMVTLPKSDPGRHLAHLAGGAMGFLFIYQMRRGNDWSVWMNQFFDWINDLFNPDRKNKRVHPRDQFYYKVHGTHPYKRIPNVTQKRIDDILDKINQEGYHALTNEEKDILRRASAEGES